MPLVRLAVRRHRLGLSAHHRTYLGRTQDTGRRPVRKMTARFTQDGRLVTKVGPALPFTAGDGPADFTPKAAAIIAAEMGSFSVYSTDERGKASEDVYTFESVKDGVATFRVERQDFKVKAGFSYSGENDAVARRV